jgi:hypothetical protein
MPAAIFIWDQRQKQPGITRLHIRNAVYTAKAVL